MEAKPTFKELINGDKPSYRFRSGLPQETLRLRSLCGGM